MCVEWGGVPFTHEDEKDVEKCDRTRGGDVLGEGVEE